MPDGDAARVVTIVLPHTDRRWNAGAVSTNPLHGWAAREALDDEMDLVRRSGLVLRVGRMSLASGTGSYRVKSSMAAVAAALGIERHQAHVTLTEITTTSHRGRSFRTEVTESRDIGVNADRLTRLQLLVSSLRGRSITPAELEERLDEIERRRPLWSPLLSGVWAGIACGAFAFLLGEGWAEMLGAALGAFAGQVVRRLLLARRYNQLGVTMLAALTATLVFLGAVTLLTLAGVAAGGPQSGFIASVLFLVPGFAIVTAALDLARLDLSAGLARLTYAVVIVCSAAIVIWAVSHTFGATPSPPPAVTGTVLLRLAQLAASFVGVLGFALMFNSPVRTALAAAAVGALPNVGRIAMIEVGASAAVAAAAAALVVGVVAAYVAPTLKIPRITVSVPAVVIMVPGSATYLAVSGLGDGATSQTVAYAVQAVVVVLGISVGLAVARMLTDREWAFER